ncbi:unnamed protein product [Leptidea sinapis]|uniref:Uncharacterized protein n=1 Tax=Leptidea sinapis TaxID=189913 RepID=A0A5E4R678_9NEOP|nr:unnamed protein product [Leptidea sinapis]
MSRSERPNLSNLNALLGDILARCVTLRKDDSKLYYNVFTNIFYRLHATMKTVDEYYNRYSSDIRFAGSHYDRLRINRLDEFDMDIVIGVPVNTGRGINENDIEIEQTYPGFVQLRAGRQYQNISIRDGTDCVINRAAHSWLDAGNYISRAKFTSWFRHVVDRALNTFPRQDNSPALDVDGVLYNIRLSASGPACTLIIERPSFRLDVDLVPALKFPETRWPIGRNYRSIPLGCSKGYWLVVPKPNKEGQCAYIEKRSWRISLHEQERCLLHDSNNLRQAVRLLKKFRDTQKMKKIASYYIKTLFLLEANERDPRWGRENVAIIFEQMLRKFHSALINKNIPYFWNRQQNIIRHIDNIVLDAYALKVNKFIQDLQSDYRSAVKYLLTPPEQNYYLYLY